MGGFILTINNKKYTEPEIEKDYSKSLNVFNERGQKLYKTIKNDEFTLFLFNKLNYQINNYLEIGNGDFIAFTGALIYRNNMGHKALNHVYQDFISNKDIDKNLSGNYCILLYVNKKLYLTRDYYGYYPVYKSSDQHLFSSSFLALAHHNPNLTISKHELYEYLFSAFFYTNKTLFREIEAIDNTKIIQVIPKFKTFPRKIEANHNFKDHSFKESVDIVADSLLKLGQIFKENYSNNISTALSGGYDSRLIFAIMRNIGIDPYLYVYGKKDNIDVIVSSNITKGEDLKMHFAKSNEKLPEIEDFYKHYKKMYFFYDGLIENGVFDNGSDFNTRKIRSENGKLQINGAGGEIYREVWNYPNKSIKIRDFFTLKYDIADYSFCSNEFDKKEHIKYFEGEVAETLNISRNYISRIEMEMLFMKIRMRLAIFNHIGSQIFSPTIMPFTDPHIVSDSYTLPYKFKLYGKFQNELIKKLDPQLASYKSAYGINFSDPIPLKYKLQTHIKQQLPLSMVVLLKQYKRIHKKADNIKIHKSIQNLFPENDLIISNYIDVNKIMNLSMLSRAYSIELLLNKIFFD